MSFQQSITSSRRCDDFYSPRQQQAKATGGLSKYQAFDRLKACRCGHALAIVLDGEHWVWSCRACGFRKLSTGGRKIARRAAHEAFDALWQDALPLYGLSKGDSSLEAKRCLALARKRAYTWLRWKLGRELDHGHIGHSTTATCKEIVRLCEGVTASDIRAWDTRATF